MFSDYFKTRCEKFSARPFVEHYETGEALTYAAFSELVQKREEFLRKQAFSHPPLLLTDNSLSCLATLFAFLVERISFVIGKPILTEEEIQRTAAVTGSPHVIEPSGDVRKIRLARHEASAGTGPEGKFAYIIFTSGSSGQPKGIKITAENIIEETQSMVRAYGLSGEDRHLCVLPIYHVSGLYRNILMAFDQGAQTVLVKDFKYPSFWKMIEERQITYTQVTPTIIRNLLQAMPEGYRKPEKFRFVGSASAPHPKEMVRQFEETFGVPLLVGYGMTEASCGITLNADIPRKNYSVGKPIDRVTLSIVDEGGEACPPGKKGEIVVEGKTVMSGYVNEEAGENIRFEDGKLFTGDLGHTDKDGYVYITGRKSDIIKRGDSRISLIEIEAALQELNAVREASVIDVPHDILGTDIVGFAVLNNESNEKLNSRRILAELKKHLERTKLPSEIVIIETLPKFDELKVNKQALKEQYRAIIEKRKQKRTVAP